MIQGSQEWHDYRRTRIGASDFALMCSSLGYSVNLFNKSVELSINDKLEDKRLEDNFYTLLGKELEPILLNYLNELGVLGTPAVDTHYDNNKIMASFDCYDKQNNILVEIKTTSKSIDKYDELIKYYQYQVVHQYYTLGTSPISYIFIYNCKNLINLTIDKIRNLIKNNYDFIMQDIINNSQLITIDCNEIMDKNTWLDICNKYLDKMDEIQNNKNNIDIINLLERREQIKYDIDLLKEQSDILKSNYDILTNCVKNKYKESTVVGDYKITVSNVKSKKINYEQYIKDNNIILDDKYYNKIADYEQYIKDNNIKLDTKYYEFNKSYIIKKLK